MRQRNREFRRRVTEIAVLKVDHGIRQQGRTIPITNEDAILSDICKMLKESPDLVSISPIFGRAEPHWCATIEVVFSVSVVHSNRDEIIQALVRQLNEISLIKKWTQSTRDNIAGGHLTCLKLPIGEVLE